MKMSNIPFSTTDWQQIEPTEHAGEAGMAYWRTRVFSGIRVRLVEYTSGYREELSRFFFGDTLGDKVRQNNWVIVPECTGIWWLKV